MSEKDSVDNVMDKYNFEIVNRGNCMMCGKELKEGLFFCRECEEKIQKTKNDTAK